MLGKAFNTRGKSVRLDEVGGDVVCRRGADRLKQVFMQLRCLDAQRLVQAKLAKADCLSFDGGSATGGEFIEIPLS
ncbi:hypothetical protein D9M69_535090 [compost metagenome]